jgi:hypothetical protein
MAKPQRFQNLAEQFETLAHNLTVCQDPKPRRELLIGMMVVLNQIDDIMSDQSLSASKPVSTTPSNPPPLSKAANRLGSPLPSPFIRWVLIRAHIRFR